jgi:hypothetical protein
MLEEIMAVSSTVRGVDIVTKFLRGLKVEDCMKHQEC